MSPTIEQLVLGLATDFNDRLYLDPTQTAKVVRAALKERFPKVKFSVRTSYFSMGSAVDVRWTDGPDRTEVDAAVGYFCAGSFDGMTDSFTYQDSTVAGRRVRFGAKYIGLHREAA